MKTKNKICYLVTFHTPINFGAVLQATALSNYLNSIFDLDVYVINFRSRALTRVYPIIRFQKSLGGIKAFLIDSLNIFNSPKKGFITFKNKAEIEKYIENVLNMHSEYFSFWANSDKLDNLIRKANISPNPGKTFMDLLRGDNNE